MTVISDFRDKHPEYNDMSDGQLAAALYRKSYSDMPVLDFAKAFGLDKSAAPEFFVAAAKDGTTRLSPEREAQVRAADQKALDDMRPSLAARAWPVVGDMAAGVTSGVAQGAAELVGLPGTLLNMAEAPFRPEGKNEFPAPLSGEMLRNAMSKITGGFTEYKPETTPGDYAQTVGQFLPGAGGSVGSLVRYGLIPALASETAGQATEGTSLEPWARTGAALLASVAAGKPHRVPSNVDAETARMAETMRGADVPVTAGQIRDSRALRRMEGTLTATDRQAEALTRAAMRSAGSDAARATPDAIAAAQTSIVDGMDKILSGVDIVPPQSIVTRADDVLAAYMLDTPANTVVPRIRNIAAEMSAAAKSGDAIPLETMRKWRSWLGSKTMSNDEALASAAHGMRDVIDAATDTALAQSGRAGDIAALRDLRVKYRNWLAVSDAATRAGAERGLISAPQLNQSVIRSQGRQTYSTGRGTDLADLSRAGTAFMRQAPTVEAGGIRRFAPEIGGGGLGGALGFAGGGVPGAIAGATLGTAAPQLGQAVMRSPQIQSYLLAPGAAMTDTARIIPGLLAR